MSKTADHQNIVSCQLTVVKFPGFKPRRRDMMAGQGSSDRRVAAPLALQHARVFSRSIQRESEIRGGQTLVWLRLHITAVQEIRVPVVIAEEFFVERFKRRRLDKHCVHPDGARED